jgi:hypothetical protein
MIIIVILGKILNKQKKATFMFPKISVFIHFICVFAVTAFFCHVVPNAACSQSEDIYNPKLPQGINTLDEAKKDLSVLLGGGKQSGHQYYGQPNINNAPARMP